MLPLSAERVLVVGSSAAGKTTLARALATRRGLPWIELDALFWGPHWTPKPEHEFRRLVTEATAGTRWIVDGNYANVRDLLWPRATTLIWLNYGFGVLMRRALARTVERLTSGAELWHGNRESIRRAFLSRESILVWVATTYRARRSAFNRIRADATYPNLHWIELRAPRAASALLETMEPR